MFGCSLAGAIAVDSSRAVATNTQGFSANGGALAYNGAAGAVSDALLWPGLMVTPDQGQRLVGWLTQRYGAAGPA